MHGNALPKAGGLKILPVVNDSCVENSMATVHHVIIQRNEHGSRVGGDRPNYTRIHCQILLSLRRSQDLQLLYNLNIKKKTHIITK